MTNKELAKKLLELDTANLSDVREQTRGVLRRDRRRVRILAILALVCWFGAAIALYSCCGMIIVAYSQLPAGEEVAATLSAKTAYQFMIWLSAAIESLLFAGLFTILLLFSTRRATLRQVNSNLAAISQQLKTLTPGETS